jgi:hypothetical protein
MNNKTIILIAGLQGALIGSICGHIHDSMHPSQHTRKMLRKQALKSGKPIVSYRTYTEYPHTYKEINEIKVCDGIVIGGHERF